MLTRNPSWKKYQKYQILKATASPTSKPLELRKKKIVKLSEINAAILNEQMQNSNVFFGLAEKEYTVENGLIVEVEAKAKAKKEPKSSQDAE
jgi:hypothetical protein